MKFGIHIHIDKLQPMRLSNDIWDWSRFCQVSNSEKSETGPISLNLLVYFDKILHTHSYSYDLERDCQI